MVPQGGRRMTGSAKKCNEMEMDVVVFVASRREVYFVKIGREFEGGRVKNSL